MVPAAVEMRNITKVFNNKAAIDEVNFVLQPGTIHGLLGENGAGKTTLMNVLYGLYKKDAGEIIVKGIPVDINSPEKAISLGIGMVHQHFMLANPLTVTENIMASRFAKHQVLLHENDYRKRIIDLAERYKMDIDPDSFIWQNSVGEQQRIEILSVLFQEVDVLILDEPTAVLTPREVDNLFHTLKKLAEDGKSIVLITHKLNEVISIADEVTVLRNGKNVGCCDVDNQTCTKDLSTMMIGYELNPHFNKTQNFQSAKDVLIAKNLIVKSDKELEAVRDLSLNIKEGEILGLAGVDGNGQKELCEALTGLRPLVSGSVSIVDEDISKGKPLDFIEAGVAYVPEDRKELGLALGWGTDKNLVLKCFASKEYTKHGLVDVKKISKQARKLIDRFDIRLNNEKDSVKDLSGGNQQKVILARELQKQPVLLIANQPTRGVDVNASLNIRSQILEARNQGAGVLLISADLEEIMQLSDRIAVIYDGRIMAVLPGNATVAEIGPLMLGQKGDSVNEKKVV